MPLILGGSAPAAPAFSIDNSCRFNDDDSAYMHKTPGSAGNRQTFTISCWIKRGQITTTCPIFSAWTADTVAGHFVLGFDSAERLDVSTYSTNVLSTTAIFRDPSAWYHVVCAVDTTESTADNRVRLYVNGTEQSNYSTRNNPVQDVDLQANNDVIQVVGANYYTSAAQTFTDGYLAEFCMIDGQQLTPSSFGEFDSDSPTIWKPIAVSGLTFGTNGFYLDFEDSANLGNDANGGTDLTEVNLAAADQATDAPTNNFCTMNPLDNTQAASTFSEGNCKFQTTNAFHGFNTGTLCVSTGKWYFEAKVAAESSANSAQVGVTDNTGEEQYKLWSCYPYIGTSVNGYGYKGNGLYANDNSSWNGGFATYTTSIISVYLDLDNSKMYWAKDDTLQNSGTGIWGAALPAGTLMFPAAGDFQGSYNVLMEMNFGGCPAFAITSGVADANGYGNFEYDPSRGGASDFDSSAKNFYAFCTKNLAEFG